MVVIKVLNTLVSLFIILIIGYILRRRKIIDARVTKGISAVVVNVGMPAMILYGLQVPFSTERLKTLGIVTGGFTIVIAVGLVIGFVVCRLRGVSLQETGSWIVGVAFSNAILMAKPVAESIFGAEAIAFPICGIMFSFNLLSFSVGVILINLGKTQKGGLGKQILKSLVNPALVFTIVGLALFCLSISLPASFVLTFDMLGGLTTPLSMLVIGSNLSEMRFREILLDGRGYLISLLRQVATPLVCFLILRPLIADAALLGLVMISAMMPVATVVALFGEQYDNNAKFLSSVVFLSTCLSLVTVPLLVMLIL